MSGSVRWSYAINQWDPNIDDFVRDEDHERACKAVSISGFAGIELTAGNFLGWEPWGNPNAIRDRYGSLQALRERLRGWAIEAVSSWVLDVSHDFFGAQPMAPGQNPLDPADRAEIARACGWFAEALRELGGSTLVVKPVSSAWQTGPLSDDAIGVLAETWNAAGAVARDQGVRLALHLDFLSALRVEDGLERLLAASDPALVGVALDTAEFAISGIEPVSFAARHPDRLWHVQLKGARETVSDEEALLPGADQWIRIEGGEHQVARWFYEPSDDPGLIDFEALARELAASDYRGWIVVETDGSPHPAKSTMLSGWYVQRVLEPLLRSGAGVRSARTKPAQLHTPVPGAPA